MAVPRISTSHSIQTNLRGVPNTSRTLRDGNNIKRSLSPRSHYVHSAGKSVLDVRMRNKSRGMDARSLKSGAVSKVSQNRSLQSRAAASQVSDYDARKFNPYFFGGAGSEMGSHKSPPTKMSKEVQDRLYGKTHHMCTTRLCSTHHFGKRVYPPPKPPEVPKRAVSVVNKRTYTDRSLSPMRLSEGANRNGHRRLAENVNKDWALSEIYQNVKARFKDAESGGHRNREIEENFK